MTRVGGTFAYVSDAAGKPVRRRTERLLTIVATWTLSGGVLWLGTFTGLKGRSLLGKLGASECLKRSLQRRIISSFLGYKAIILRRATFAIMPKGLKARFFIATTYGVFPIACHSSTESLDAPPASPPAT
ncbi:hypothetical protein BHE74_00054274 [Ensete ventricosum]|nr:hypothetical protein BHE74_00054274 [Ensete ventricosum]